MNPRVVMSSGCQSLTLKAVGIDNLLLKFRFVPVPHNFHTQRRMCAIQVPCNRLSPRVSKCYISKTRDLKELTFCSRMSYLPGKTACSMPSTISLLKFPGCSFSNDGWAKRMDSVVSFSITLCARLAARFALLLYSIVNTETLAIANTLLDQF